MTLKNKTANENNMCKSFHKLLWRVEWIDLVALLLQHTTSPCFATICATRLLHWQACPLDAGTRWRTWGWGVKDGSSQTQRVSILGLLEKISKIRNAFFNLSKTKLLLWILKQRLMGTALMLNGGKGCWQQTGQKMMMSMIGNRYSLSLKS